MSDRISASERISSRSALSCMHTRIHTQLNSSPRTGTLVTALNCSGSLAFCCFSVQLGSAASASSFRGEHLFPYATVRQEMLL